MPVDSLSRLAREDLLSFDTKAAVVTIISSPSKMISVGCMCAISQFWMMLHYQTVYCARMQWKVLIHAY